MIVTAILASAMTVKGLVALTDKQFSYKLAHRKSECVLVVPTKAKKAAAKKMPEGLSVSSDSTISGTVADGEGKYTFGVSCKGQRFNVTIQVIEPE